MAGTKVVQDKKGNYVAHEKKQKHKRFIPYNVVLWNGKMICKLRVPADKHKDFTLYDAREELEHDSHDISGIPHEGQFLFVDFEDCAVSRRKEKEVYLADFVRKSRTIGQCFKYPFRRVITIKKQHLEFCHMHWLHGCWMEGQTVCQPIRCHKD